MNQGEAEERGRAGDGGELETERCPHVIRLVADYIDLVMDGNQEIKTNTPLSKNREYKTASGAVAEGQISSSPSTVVTANRSDGNELIDHKLARCLE